MRSIFEHEHEVRLNFGEPLVEEQTYETADGLTFALFDKLLKSDFNDIDLSEKAYRCKRVEYVETDGNNNNQIIESEKSMDIFNGNRRLENHIMYALEWAKFVRHDKEAPLIPFLFEWEEEQLYVNKLVLGGDPEPFAYRMAKDSKRNSDQFVLGYEGILQDEAGEQKTAFIVKGYDKTQETGVFLAQLFEGKEKGGTYQLLDKPMFIEHPKLPIPLNTEMQTNYAAEDVFFSGIALKNGDQVGIFSDSNPAMIASGIQRYVRGKLEGASAHDLSGRIECNIAPQEGSADFMKYCIIETIHAERNSPTAATWIKDNAKPLLFNVTYGKEKWLVEFEKEDNTESPIDQVQSKEEEDTQAQQKALEQRYNQFSKEELHAEFYRIVGMPNARTNIQCLVEMSALMEVAERKGIALPSKTKQAASKSGCGAILVCFICSMIAYFLL